jgi:hypothetical protein
MKILPIIAGAGVVVGLVAGIFTIDNRYITKDYQKVYAQYYYFSFSGVSSLGSEYLYPDAADYQKDYECCRNYRCDYMAPERVWDYRKP